MVGFVGARLEETLSLQDPLLDDVAQAIRRRSDIETGFERTPIPFGLVPVYIT